MQSPIFGGACKDPYKKSNVHHKKFAAQIWVYQLSKFICPYSLSRVFGWNFS
jgi:hypothetical protein